MTHITCRLTAKNRDQLRNPTLGNRVWATFTFFIPFLNTNIQSVSNADLEIWKQLAVSINLVWVWPGLDVQWERCCWLVRRRGRGVRMVGQLPMMTGSCSFARTSVGCRRQSRDIAARSAEPTASVHTVVNKVSSVRSAPSLLQFRRDLKTALFQSSYSSP